MPKLSSYPSRKWHMLIAENEKWLLFELPDEGRYEWRHLHLVREGRRLKKRSWWLSWNGERLAGSSDEKILQENYPEIHEWVIDSAEEADRTQKWEKPITTLDAA